MKLQEQEDGIADIEKRIRTAKSELKTLSDELEHKLLLKRFGASEFTAESKELLRGVNEKIAALDINKKDYKKISTALKKDKAALETRLAKTDELLKKIGGQLTEAEAEKLILKKLFDLVDHALQRYANAEKSKLIVANDNFWDKYAISSRALELKRLDTMGELEGHLVLLGYST